MYLFQDFCKLENREKILSPAPHNTALSQESLYCIFSAEIKEIKIKKKRESLMCKTQSTPQWKHNNFFVLRVLPSFHQDGSKHDVHLPSSLKEYLRNTFISS